MSENASQIMPIGVGDVKNGTFELSISLPEFKGPVDVYLAIYAPGISNEFILIWPDGSLHPLKEGIVPWKEDITQGVKETLYRGVSTSYIPTGIYHLYCLVTAHNGLQDLAANGYYLWSTYFFNAPCSHTIAPALLGFSNNETSIPFLIDQNGQLAIGSLDENGTDTLINSLIPQDSLCNIELNEEAQDILKSVSTLLEEDDLQGALQKILDYLDSSVDGRTKIKVGVDLLDEFMAAGSLEYASTLLAHLRTYFNNMVSTELASSDIDEALTILKDATTLWAAEARSQALSHLRYLTLQALEDDLRAFDPCTSDTQTLKNRLQSLVNSTARAKIFGVMELTSSVSNTQDLFEAVDYTLQKAVENYNSLEQGQGLALSCGTYAMNFTLQGANGYATLTGDLHSCDGITGSWTGEIEVVIDVPGTYSCNAKAHMHVHPDQESLTSKGTLDFEDINCTISATNCTVKSVRDSLKYEITFSRDRKKADLYFSSTGAGIISFTCDDGQSASEHTYLWATFWGDNRSTAELTDFDGCDSGLSLW